MIQLISRAKYLEPEISEPEMVNKLAHHFGRGIQITVITQRIKSLEELPLLLTKCDDVDNQSSGNNNNEPARKQFQPLFVNSINIVDYDYLTQGGAGKRENLKLMLAALYM